MKLNITKEWLLNHIDDEGDCSAGSPAHLVEWLKLNEGKKMEDKQKINDGSSEISSIAAGKKKLLEAINDTAERMTEEELKARKDRMDEKSTKRVRIDE